MNILKAATDKNLFARYLDKRGELSSWLHWLTFLRTLHGLPLDESEHETVRHCTGRDPALLPKNGFDEALVLAGRRSGKSKLVSLVAAYEAVLSGREKKLSVGELPMVAVVSPTRFQSRVIHGYLRGALTCAPILKRELVEDKRESFTLKNGCEVSILTGDPRTVRGFSVTCALVDEIAFFGLSEESKVRSDTELVRALRPSLATTGGRLICVGSPYKASGYAFNTFRRCFGNDSASTLVWNAASTYMNPTLSADVVARALEEDHQAASVEYCVQPGLFREDVEQFVSRELVESLVIRGRKQLEPCAGIGYACFADVSGGRADDAALAIGHKHERKIILDIIERYPAPHNPYEVVAKMTATMRRYGCDRAIGDAYAAEWTRTAFQSHGVDYRRASRSVWHEGSQIKNRVAKPKSMLYLDLLPRLTSAEVELLDNEALVSQLCSLQRRTRSGGRDSIDHPPGLHDDLANVAAGVCDAVSQRQIVAGAGVGGEVGEHVTALQFALQKFDADRALYDLDQQQAQAGPDLNHQYPWMRVMAQVGRYRPKPSNRYPFNLFF